MLPASGQDFHPCSCSEGSGGFQVAHSLFHGWMISRNMHLPSPADTINYAYSFLHFQGRECNCVDGITIRNHRKNMPANYWNGMKSHGNAMRQELKLPCLSGSHKHDVLGVNCAALHAMWHKVGASSFWGLGFNLTTHKRVYMATETLVLDRGY